MHRRPAHPTEPPNWYGSRGCTGCLSEVCGACVPYDPRVFEWPEELQMVRDAVRQFVDNEIRPHRDELAEELLWHATRAGLTQGG